jgi:hypothetical protein
LIVFYTHNAAIHHIFGVLHRENAFAGEERLEGALYFG